MNLANAQTRDSRQGDPLAGRASVLPERRNTNAPDLRPSGDMRSARRGDVGGADALMRTLGLVERAAGDFQDYAQRKHTADEQDNISQGFGDQAIDRVDPEKMERSLGYRDAVTKGRTVTEFAKATREFGQALDDVIERQNSPLLEDRQGEARLMVEEFYKNFATDPETGELREYLASPGAMRYLAGAIQESRPQFEANALKRIEERFNAEARSHVATNIVDQARATGGVDYNAARSLLPATVTDEQFAETVLVATINAANALHADGRTEEATQLLAALRGYSTKGLEVPVGEAGPTGTVPTGSQPATATGGRVSFNTLRNAVEFVESRGDPNAVSPKGARGTMQTMPATLRDPGYGVRPAKDDSSEELTRVGNDYLKAMLKEYNGDLVFALAAYNWGPGNVDGWKASVAGKSMAQKVAAIPVKETRDYVASVLQRAGVATSGSATAATNPELAPVPGYRLTDPFADPVTAAQQSGVITAEIVGLEGIHFSASQQARINEVYEVTTDQMRREWKAKVAEEQSQNATRLALGLFGVGGVTTRQDILDARASQQIDDNTMLTLLRTQQSNEEQRQNEIDRQLDRVEREEAKKLRRMEEAAVGSLVGALARGDINAAELRAATLSLLPNLPPAIQGSVLGTTLSIANGMESALANSAPARSHTTRWNTMGASLSSRVVEWGIVPSQRKNVQALAESAIETGQAKFLQRVIAGEDPEKVAEEVDTEIGTAMGALVRRFGVQGQP